VHEWNEDELPSIAEVRELFASRSAGRKESAPIDARGKRLIPVPDIAEVLADGDVTDYGQLEPVPSAFYDDLDEPQPQRRVAHAG
jgi:hypothetical protein